MTQEIGDSKLLDSWAANGGLSEPDLSKIDVGFQSGERPIFQHMNWLQNLFCNKLNHILSKGIPLWNSETTYAINAFAVYNGVVYKATVENTDDQPPSANWTLLVPPQIKNTAAASDPTVNDDNTEGYEVFSRWVNTSSGESFILLDASTGAAIWETTTLTLDDLGTAALNNTGDFATAAQGALADSALQPGDITPSFTLEYASTGQTITSAGALTLAHGLGVVPKLMQAYLICLTAEAGYSIGDKILINPHYQLAATVSQGASVHCDATNIYVRYGQNSYAFSAIDKTTGIRTNLTNARWQYYITAWA